MPTVAAYFEHGFEIVPYINKHSLISDKDENVTQCFAFETEHRGNLIAKHRKINVLDVVAFDSFFWYMPTSAFCSIYTSIQNISHVFFSSGAFSLLHLSNLYSEST